MFLRSPWVILVGSDRCEALIEQLTRMFGPVPQHVAFTIERALSERTPHPLSWEAQGLVVQLMVYEMRFPDAVGVSDACFDHFPLWWEEPARRKLAHAGCL